jgi:excisionase family DNA binding protein
VYQKGMKDPPAKRARKPSHGAAERAPVQLRAGGEELCTVEEAARRLKLHPRTILRFIHEDRLPATRVGKSFRILRRDLDAFAGLPPEVQAAHEPAVVTCIVDIPQVGPDLAQRWARVLPAVLNTRTGDRPPVRAEIVYDPDRSQLKIMLVSTPDVVGSMLKLVEMLLEQPPS